MMDDKKTPYLYVPEESCPDFDGHALRYLNSQQPTAHDLDQWIGVPLFQKQDTPIDSDGRPSVLLAHVDVLRQLVEEYDRLKESRSTPMKKEESVEPEEEENEMEEGEIIDS